MVPQYEENEEDRKTPNMKLKCINTGDYYLTLNKIYEAEICLDTKTFDYYITNDIGIRHGLEKSLFINISEMREEKLKELGIND